MITLAKICIEGIAAIVLYCTLITAKAEATTHVYKLMIAITVLSAIAGTCWFFI